MEIIIDIPANLGNHLVDEFEKRILFISEKIVSYEKLQNDKNVESIILTINANEKEAAKIKERANYIFYNDIIGLKEVCKQQVWNNDAEIGKSKEMLQELIDVGIVKIPAKGQVAFKEPLISLYRFFDDIFRKIAIELLGSEEYMFPTLLKTSVLKRVGYFDSFPNHLMFASRIKNDLENFTQFKETFEEISDVERKEYLLKKFCKETGYGLPPTMCYYIYEMLYDSEVANCSYTTMGRSFRYEGDYQKPFELLWDFSIRETVFLGDINYVRDKLAIYRTYTIRLMEELGLKGICECGNDPFFLVPNMPMRINVQKMYGTKMELKLRIDKEKLLAIGSFNTHGQFISKRFRLYSNKETEKYIYTGCVGIGLERMIFAFIAQYGYKQEDWPEIVKRSIENSGYMYEKYSDILLKKIVRGEEVDYT